MRRYQHNVPITALAITGQKMVNESRQAGAEALAVSGPPKRLARPQMLKVLKEVSTKSKFYSAIPNGR